MRSVAFVITDLEFGGAELAMVRYIGWLLETGEFDVAVCSLKGRGPVAEHLEKMGVPIENIDLLRLQNTPVAMVRFWGWLRRTRPEVTCSFMFHANFLTRLTGLCVPTGRTLCFERTMAQESLIRRRLNRHTVWMADRVVAVSPAVLRYCLEELRVPTHKTALVENSVDTSEPGPEPEKTIVEKGRLGFERNQLVIMWAGVFRAVKGVPILIEAFARLRRRYPEARLLLVGGGPDKDDCVAHADSNGLRGLVLFHPWVPSLRTLLAVSDIFALPSVTEGMSNVALEAMAAAKPIVATRVGGTPDLIEDGVTGLLVPSGDPEALYRGLVRLVENPEFAAELGRRARQRIEERHSTEAVRQQLLRLLQLRPWTYELHHA